MITCVGPTAKVRPPAETVESGTVAGGMTDEPSPTPLGPMLMVFPDTTSVSVGAPEPILYVLPPMTT